MSRQRYGAATDPFSHVLATVAVAAAGCGSEASTAAEPTFWQDVAPVMAGKCVPCHQENGIGPFRLDEYAPAAEHAAAIDRATQGGHMPPFLVAHDGSCGDFQDDEALTPAELASIHAWAGGARAEGRRVEIHRPPIPTLNSATEYTTPLLVPVADANNPLGAEDEYRCLPFEPGIDAARFITGYQVIPGVPAIVHHVSLYVVKPDAPSHLDGKTNGDLMAAYDAASPDRPGWSCFGAAGDGITFESFPVTWAAGQLVVEYPHGAGISVSPTDRFVVQMHYNLHSRPNANAADATRIRLRYADSVSRRALSLAHDPFLGSLFGDAPHMLVPNQPRVRYEWKNTREEMGLDPSLPPLEVLGVLPHMHGRGRQYELRHRSGDRNECIARVDDWDVHWQKVYWYQTPPVLDVNSSLEVTCTFDTQGAVAPVLPGWGSANEMCLMNALLALPEGR